MIHILDTFKDFELCFQGQLDVTIEEKIHIWENNYMSKYPELERKLKEDYESNGYSWRKIAEEMVFNRTKDDFSKMTHAYGNLSKLMDNIDAKVKEIFHVDLDVNIVLYSGLCNSAGWVDFYNSKRAILFGIDKIAELNWDSIEKLESLVAHELCHVIHFEIRGEDGLSKNTDSNKYNEGIWNLYEEGFAQFFQYILLGEERDSRGREWFEQCEDKEYELKKLYLAALSNEEKGTKDFFGDWYEVLGISDVGYYLGSEFIRMLHSQYNIEYIAKLQFDEIKNKVENFLKV